MIKRIVAIVLSTLLLAPSAVIAQSERAGVVTTLEGNVSARRVALQDPVALKFRDDVFLQDTITTGDKSLARMLLGGKAVVTVRERSVLKITEVPGRSTVELETGKFALAVAREKMRPGEEIQIRTPNAIAGVRGTVVITEVSRQTAQLGRSAGGVLTRFYVLRGNITAQPLDVGTRQPLGTPLAVGAMQAYSGVGTATPSVSPVAADQVGQITSGLQPSGMQGSNGVGQEQVKEQAVETALALANTLTGSGGTQMAAVVAPDTTSIAQSSESVRPDLGVCKTEQDCSTLLSAQPSTGAVVIVGGGGEEIIINPDLFGSFFASFFFGDTITGSFTLIDQNAATFNSFFSSVSPNALLTIAQATIQQIGANLDFILVGGGANVSLAGPLAIIHDSSIQTPGALFHMIGGTFSSSSSAPFFDLDPTIVTTSDSFIKITGGALTLGGALLADLGGTLTNGDPLSNALSFVSIANAAQVTSTGSSAFVNLSGTTLDTSGSILTLRGTVGGTPTRLTLAGPLLAATNSGINHTSAGFFETFGTILQACCTGFFIGQGAQLTSTTPDALIQLTSTTVTGADGQSGGPFFFVGHTFEGAPASDVVAPASVSLAGPLVQSTGSTITALLHFLGITESSLTSTSGAPLVGITGSSVTLGGPNPFIEGTSFGNFLLLSGSQVDGTPGFGASMSLAGPLASFVSSAILAGQGDLAGVLNGATFTSTGAGAMFHIDDSTITAFNLLLVRGTGGPSGTTPAYVALAGPVLSANASEINLGRHVVAVDDGTSLTSTTTAPLIQLTETNLMAGDFVSDGALLHIDGSSTSAAVVTLHGPALNSTDSNLMISGPLLAVFDGGQLIVNTSEDPVFSITGGEHTIGTAEGVDRDALFVLNGVPTLTDFEEVESGVFLELGTHTPVQATGSLLDLTSALVTTNKVLRLDTALLEASAPIINLKAASGISSATDAIDLIQKAKLTTGAINPLIRLDGGSHILVNNGSLVAVRGGSFLNIGGDMLAMNNGSTVTLNNGTLLFASGGSVVRIQGALVNFGGVGNTINITNNLCAGGCPIFGGIKVFLTNGAVVGNVSVDSPITNPGGGTINFSNGANTAHITVDGPNTKVRIGNPG